MLKTTRLLAAAALGVLLAAASLAGQLNDDFSSSARDGKRITEHATTTAPATIPELLQRAADQGTVRVIVSLARSKQQFVPDGELAEAAAAAQHTNIQQLQGNVLTVLPQVLQEERYRSFNYIPYMALELTQGELQTLIDSGTVSGIEEDKLARPQMQESAPRVGAPQAWASKYTGAGQTVAVLDTGVDKNHPFLQDKVVSEACYSTTSNTQNSTSLCPGGAQSSTANGSGLPCTSISGCDHGTHVAGTVAGNGSSYSGVAKDAKLIAIQVFSKFPSSICDGPSPCLNAWNSDLVAAMEHVYSLRNTLHIAAVNMSLGGGAYTNSCDVASPSAKAAMDNLASAKIATVAASGNGYYADAISWPACISSAISVGASYDITQPAYNECSNPITVDRIPCYSNIADFLDLVAPGSFITSSVPGGGYNTKEGTSMATPHVAGAWALLRQKNKDITPAVRKNTFRNTGAHAYEPFTKTYFKRIRVNNALASTPSPFTDVADSSGFAPYINTMHSTDVTAGCGSGNYCPGSNVTRDQMAVFIVKAMGESPSSCASGSPFTDVFKNSNYCPYIKKLVDLGITSGCGNGNYCPSSEVTRGQMAVFIVKGMGESTLSCASSSPFTDVSKNSNYCPYIKKLVSLNITAGCGNGKYCPNTAVTRGQMAVFLGKGFIGMP